MKKCSVDGCDNAAIAELLGTNRKNRGYRCESCLEYDLDL